MLAKFWYRVNNFEKSGVKPVVAFFEGLKTKSGKNQRLNRYRRKRPKVDASIFDSALSHNRRSNASEKIEENSVSTFGRFRLCTSFESSPVS